MKATSPPLLPILRSATQARLLTAMFMEPEVESSVTDLASRVGTSVPTATREVARAEKAGIVTSRHVGRSRLVRVNVNSYVYEPLSQLLLRSFGPITLVSEEFTKIGGVERLFIFGSWAARYAGEAGPAPQDLDVMIIGNPNRDEVYEAADKAERQMHRPVHATIRTAAQWQSPDEDSFIKEVQRRPLLEVSSDASIHP